MNAPAAFLAIRWLIWDTFRQAQASAIFWAMLVVSFGCIVFCATVSTSDDLPIYPTDEAGYRLPASKMSERDKAREDGVEVIDGEIRFLFGSVRVKWSSWRDDAVRWLQLLMAGGIADTAGLWLALIWTAAFLPSFLEPASVTVLLAKPVPRWSLLAGKFLGVLVLVLFQATVFVVGTWLALGFATGIWDGRYLLAIPMLLLHFTMFFSFSVMLAVWTRSTIVCIFGSLLFWFMCWGMNYGRHFNLVVLSKQPDATVGLSGALEVGYWVLPKPADMGFLLSQALNAEKYFPVSKDLALAHIDPTLSILSSLAFSAVMLAIACYEFIQADY
jgi:ABC-type transport system involved in multi-copper enzyme maturation permease subunit